MLKKVRGVLVAIAPAAVALPSFAAVDAAITTAVSTAQTDALTVAGIVTALAVAVWGALYLKRKFFG